MFVRSFYDSDGDGIGDINGLIQKLDYINDGGHSQRNDLGARCIWLMPVAESPSYHGYDVTNYYRVEPDYGTNADFKRLIAEAHRRGIKVLVDLVLNHASSEHPFFKEALRDTASAHRDWFVWSPKKPVNVAWGSEVWHHSPERDEYYYGLFWHGMPDLNYKTPAVREEAKKIARFWLREMGVDGFRLDAISFLVEENGQLLHTSGTHAFLREFSAYVRTVAPGAATIGEVWDSTGAMLPYYPDQLDAHFAFDISNAIIEAVRTSSAKKLFPPVMRLQRELPANRWAPFLRNHDQTRTMMELGGSVARAKLAATILLTLPGVPFVYYGEEIGMSGNKPDERLRTPMQWSRRHSAGFTRGHAWQPLQSDSSSANVQMQHADSGSLLNLYRRLIHLRAENPALASGDLVPLTTNSDVVAAYLRRNGASNVLVVINLGGTALSGVRVSSPDGALPARQYTLRNILDGQLAARLVVLSDGRIRSYVPFPTLGPMQSHLFDVFPRAR
ncbi:MAG: alpha-amylase family glycosyl hydrolase [Gemmatimonadaceae bacterium]